jgi:hypothetical protein
MPTYDPVLATQAFYDLFRNEGPEAAPLSACEQLELMDRMPLGFRHLQLLALAPRPLTHAAIKGLCDYAVFDEHPPDTLDRIIVTTPAAFLHPAPGRIIMHPQMRMLLLASYTAQELGHMAKEFLSRISGRLGGTEGLPASEAATLHAHLAVLVELLQRTMPQPGDTPKERQRIVRTLCTLLIGPEADLPLTGALLRMVLPTLPDIKQHRIPLRLHAGILLPLERAAQVHGISLLERLALEADGQEDTPDADPPDAAGRTALIHLVNGRTDLAERTRTLIKIIGMEGFDDATRIGMAEHALQCLAGLQDTPERIALLLTLGAAQHSAQLHADAGSTFREAWTSVVQLERAAQERTRVTVLYYMGRHGHEELGRQFAADSDITMQYFLRICALTRGMCVAEHPTDVHTRIQELRYLLDEIPAGSELREAQITLAQVLHESGDTREAALLIRTMPPPEPRGFDVRRSLEATRMAAILVHGGEFEQAHALARALGDTPTGRAVQARIAEAFAERGDQEQAELLVQAIPNPSMCARILANLYIVFSKQHKKEAAARVLALAQERADRIPDADDRVSTLRAMARRVLYRDLREGAAVLADHALHHFHRNVEDMGDVERRQMGLLCARLGKARETTELIPLMERVDARESVLQELLVTLLRERRGAEAYYHFD